MKTLGPEQPNIMQLPVAITAIQKQAKNNPLRAFHGSAKLRDFYVARVRWHRDQDEIIAGTYGDEEDGKYRGCAVGCSIHGSEHAAYETELGIPSTLARFEDSIFEALYGLDTEAAKEWPVRFIEAPKLGADLTMIWPKFAHWLLIDEEHGVLRFAKTDRSKKAIRDVAALYAHWIGGDKPCEKEWRAAYAAYAAYDATYAADATYATDATDATARKIVRKAQADKLIALMHEA